MDALSSVFRYNISILEYFYFNFFRLGKKARCTYAGTGYMYEYQLKMNPKKDRKALHDKRRFYEVYHSFIRHKMVDRNTFSANESIA